MAIEQSIGRDRPIPVTILSGFLGSGKTTLLNYILSENHGLKVAVIVNELGEIGIDNQLVVGLDETGDVIELSNGCICCTVRTDLYDAVLNVLKGRQEIDYLVIETTGLANPQPIAQTFFLPELESHTTLDSIVTVVDVVNFDRVIEESDVAEQQIAFADFVVLNKVSDAAPEHIRAAEDAVLEMNPYARIVHADYGRIDLNLILDVGAFSLDSHFDSEEAEAFRAGTYDAHEHHAHDHHEACGDESSHHDHAHTHFEEEGFTSASYVFDRPFVAKEFQDFLESLPGSIFRAKGILWFLGEPQRAIFNQVGSSIIVEWGREWGDTDALSQIVFIGKEFDKLDLHERLIACLDRTA